MGIEANPQANEPSSEKEKTFTEEKKAELLKMIDDWIGIFESKAATASRIGTKNYGAPAKIEKLKELRGYVERGEKKTVPLVKDVEEEIKKVINRI